MFRLRYTICGYVFSLLKTWMAYVVILFMMSEPETTGQVKSNHDIFIHKICLNNTLLKRKHWCVNSPWRGRMGCKLYWHLCKWAEIQDWRGSHCSTVKNRQRRSSGGILIFFSSISWPRKVLEGTLALKIHIILKDSPDSSRIMSLC